MPRAVDEAPPTPFFATAAKGVEAALTAELLALGIPDVLEQRGGVGFGGTIEHAYRACLWSRIAARVLMPLARFSARDARGLYDGVRAIDWRPHLGAETTLAVDVAGRNAAAGPPHFVALKTKDAIVDQVRDREGRRPDIDTDDPDVRVHVHLAGERVSLSLDLSGRGLHRRGIGRAGAKAPLKENLAAAILQLADWPTLAPKTPLFDPFCGSGTLLIEAAWMALDIAPGLHRPRLGAEGWRGHDAELWKRLQADARERANAGRRREVRLAGSDASARSLDAARQNLERAGVLARSGRGSERVLLEQQELRQVEPPWPEPGLVVTNPPYGARLGEATELVPLYQLLGDVLKRRFPGWTAWVLTGEASLAKRIGLRPASRTVLYNGPIECRLLEIPISDRPVTSEKGPGWRKPGPEGEAFAKKLVKNRRQLEKWAQRENLDAYRLYDTDMRQFNLSVDWYAGAARVEEYERPPKIDAEGADRRLREALQVIPETLGIAPSEVVLRVRSRRDGEQQHGRRDDQRNERVVREGDLRFLVNLGDYLDTGLFLDDRLLRRYIRERSSGISFLNLFSYTCTASVAAAVGGARATSSVDLSKTYLAWGRRNFDLNGFDPNDDDHRFFRGDVIQWLERTRSRRHELIFVAPPTHSRSKSMQGDFDIQRDHARLLRKCVDRLAPGGEILFTTNLRTFELDERRLRGWQVTEITEAMTPRDFARRPRLRAWSLRPAEVRTGW